MPLTNGWFRPFIPYMALAGGSFMMYHTILPLRIFHHLILTLLLLYWFIQYGLPRTPLMLPLFIVLLTALLSSLYAVDTRMAWENVWHWLTNSLLFLMVIDWFRQGREDQVFRWQFVAGGLLVGISLLEGLLTGQRIHGALFITNLTGAYAAAMVIPTLVWAKSSESQKQGRLLALLAIGLVLTVLAGQNRGALLSIGVGVVAFALLQLPSIRMKLVVGVGAAATAGILIFALSLQSNHLSGDSLRMDLWGAAGEMLITYPTGVGPGLFGQAYRQIGHTGLDYFLGAHNLYLNLGAELGALGLAAGAGVLLLFVYYLVDQKRTLKQNACLAALAGIAAHMLGDNFPSQNFTFLVGLYSAYVIYDWKVEGDYTHLLRTVKNGLILALMFYGLWLLNKDRAQIYYEQSLGGSTAAARIAVQIDPELRLYRLQLARLEDGWEAAQSYDPTLTQNTDLQMYGLVGYGRVLR